MKRDVICAQRAAYGTVFLVSLAVVIALGSWLSVAKADVFSNVPEASGFGVVYVLPIPNLPNFDATIPYSVNNSAGIADGSFSRVAYYLELEDTNTGYSEWVYASFDAAPFATEADMLGIPTPANGIVYQYNPSGATGQVENMNVFSNDPGITIGYGITTGNAEMWPTNYGQANGAGVSGASESAYDFGDTRNTSGDHGSFQLHNYGAGETLFAINHFNRGQEAEMGIGTQPSGHPDWTFNETSADYEIKNLVILAGNPLSWNGGGGTTGPLDGSGTWDASSTNWWDSASAAWTDGSNAVFGAGAGNGTAGTVTISGTVKPASIGFSTTGDGNSYTLTGGTIDLNGSVMTIRANVNATINSTLTNGGIEKLGAGNLTLGGTNTLSGTTTVSAGTLTLGATSNNTLGTVNVKGGAAGAQLVVEGTTDLGSNTMNVATAAADRSTVVISGNATMNRLYVGNYGAGAVIQDGGSVTIGPTLGGQNVLSLGFNGGYGYYQMNGGSLTVGQLAAGSGTGANNVGVFDMNGGTVNVNGGGGWLLAGGWATNAKGSLNLWGGAMTGPASNAVTLNVFARSSTGMLNMLGSTAVLDATKNSGGLNVMREANVSSIVNLNAGTIIASRVQQSGAGSAQFNFNGGTLQAKADASVTFSLNTGGSAYIYGGDANFDGGAYIDTPTSATTLTITTPLLAPTGYGATSVAIADAGAGYVGSPFVVLSGGSGVGASAIAQVDLDPSSSTYGQLTNILITSAGSGYAAGDVLTATLYGGGATTAATLGTVTLGANTSGGLTVQGSGTVTLAGANTYSGDTTIRAGTLRVANAGAIPSGAGKGNVAVDGALDVAGYTANVNGLSGAGTINNSTGNGTLVVGNNNADGVFSGVIRNTGGSLALAKVGNGTLTLTGNNSYSGGTTVSQGTLAVGSPTPTAVNPLGTGAVTLGGGTLRLSGQAAMFNTTEHPVTVTGWDKDFVWANSELTADGGSDPILNNWVYYEAGPTHNEGLNGLPTSRTFVSAADSSVTFQIEPYDGANSVWLSGTATTLTLDTPGHYSSLHLLDASGNGVPTVTYTLTFADSSTTTGTFQPLDWTHYDSVLTSLAQRSTSGGAYYNNAGLSQTDIVLSSADQAKVLNSISFTAAGGGGSWIMAVSGTSGTLGYASTQVYGNAVNVTADSTIDVRNSLAATLGSLSIGNHTLSLTGDSGASLTVGATTLSGNATFNTAADTTLNVGAIGDGSAGHGITKTGAGTMTLGGHSSYGGNTIISEGTLRLSGTTSTLGNIMPLGDSITYGSGGANAGYRGPLYALLDDEGYTFQYVGSWNNNSGSLPTTPVNQTYHEGHGGWRTGDESNGILHGVKTVADGGLGWLAVDPDVILLHIGTNNTGLSEPQSITDVGNILDQIYQQRPTATTFLAQIIPKATALTWVDQYNADLAALVGTKQAAGYNVVLVDMNTDYPTPWSTTLPDNVHPNDTGYQWMAEQWYDAVAAYLGIASENSLPGTTAVSLAASATLDLNGVNQTIASLADYNGGGGQVVNDATDTHLTLTINPGSGSTTFSGTISDSGAAGAISLVKSGAGTQILAGANTYHGGTEVNEGTLLVNNTTGSGTGSGEVVVNGGTLGGSGAIAGLVTVNSGALAPGTSPGILTLESGLTMTGGAFAVELDGLVEGAEYDQLLVTGGTVNLGEGVASLALSLGFTPEIDDLFWIINNTGEGETIGYFQGLEEGSRVEMDGGIFRIRYGADYASGLFVGGNDVLLQAIPEPATLLMLLTLGLLACRRRRRR